MSFSRPKYVGQACFHLMIFSANCCDFIRTDGCAACCLQIINSLHLPFELAAGYIGDFKVEGLLGAVAGSPLTVVISDVCLVLRRNDVDWDNELMFRYTKEMMIALLQSFSSPSYEKKKTDTTNKKSFISPAKWISVRSNLFVGDQMKASMHFTWFN